MSFQNSEPKNPVLSPGVKEVVDTGIRVGEKVGVD